MIGTRLSERYEITGELGRGGMGVVYRAKDPLLGRDVAVKLLPPTHVMPETEERFRREAQLVAQMDHPGIVPIHDFGRHADSLFLVMPVVEGKSLRGLLRDGSLTVGDVLEVGAQVADALAYSHSRGVIHRDVKPENIMASRAGGALRVRVMDFGLAVAQSHARMTQTGVVVGTMGYLSPEQVRSRDIDHRTDIYALGTVLYECLAGSPPFAGEIQSVLYRIVHEVPQPPSALGAPLDPEVEALVMACLAREPAERPQTARDVAEAMRRCQARLHDSERARTLGTPTAAHLTRPALAPFVGRAKETAELQQRLSAALAGECQLVLVGGEPGSGKTRLLDEIEALARARQVRVLHGRFFEQDRAFPYQGFCEAVQEYFRGRGSGSSTEHADFTDLLPELVALSPVLAEIAEARPASRPASVLGATTASGAPAASDDRTHVFELIARTLLRIAGGKPMVLLLEDLHHAEVSLDALQYVVRRLGPTPTLVAGTYRTTDVGRAHGLHRMLKLFHGDRRFASIVVGPFSASEHRIYVETLVGGPDLSDELVARLYEGTEGNPFFTKELVRSLLDSGAIARDDAGTWMLAGPAAIGSDALPATIQQAVEGRIERLPEDLRGVLSVAAVLGRTFDFRDLEALGADRGDVGDAVDRLVREGILEEERESRGDRLAFASGVVRDVLLGQVPRRTRRSLHRRCAEQIERRMAGRLDRVYPDLLHHFAEGDVPEKAVEYGGLLAARSLEGCSPDDGARAARAALEFLDDEWEGPRRVEGEVRMLLARALRMAGDAEAAAKHAETAAQVFEREGAPTEAVDALVFAAEAAWQGRRTEDAARAVTHGIEAARRAGATDALRRLLSLAATLENLRGDHVRANAHLQEIARLSAEPRADVAEASEPTGGCVVVAMANASHATEPVRMEVLEDAEVLTNVFETLLAVDDAGALTPNLAEKWSVEDGGRRVVLTLRRGVRFPDGHELVARDVQRSFEGAVRRIARQVPAAFAVIEGVEAFRQGVAAEIVGLVVRSDTELEVRLAAPLPIYPSLLTDFYTGVVRESAGGADGPLLGTGPFRVRERTGERVVLEPNDASWRPRPKVDALEFCTGMSSASIAAGLRQGAIDLARDLAPSDLDDLLRDPRFRRGLVEAPQKNTYFVVFRCASASPVGKAAVRRALCGAVQSRDPVWRALGRFAQPATSLLPPGILGHDPGRRRAYLSREEASLALAAAGVELPVRLRASVHPVLQDRCAPLLEALFAIWRDLGVEIVAPHSTMEEFLAAWEDPGDVDLLLSRWTGDYDDPDAFAYELFHSTAGRLRRWYSALETDRLLEDARGEGRAAVREALYRKFEAALEDRGAVLPLFHDVQYRVASPRVRGLRLRGSPPYVNYGGIARVDEGRAATETVRTGGGALRIALTGSVRAIEPSSIATDDEGEVAPCVFERLTCVVEGLRTQPWLAAELHVEDGGAKYRFRLRDDVHFHDGRKLGARDVRASFERGLRRSAMVRSLLAPVRGAAEFARGDARELAGFRIRSSTEFTVELDGPVSFFPAALSHFSLGIAPETGAAATGSWTDGLVGTGPFRVARFDPGRTLELERNPHYWRPGLPRSERLTFVFEVSPKEILAEFRAGRVSVCADLLPADVEALRRDPAIAAGHRETPHLSTYFVAMNTRKGPLADVALRRQVASALDVPAIVRHALGRLAVPAAGLIPPGLVGHDPAGTGRTPAARRADAAPVSLTAAVHPLFRGRYAVVADDVLRALRRGGFDVRRPDENVQDYLAAAEHGAADLLIGRWVADYPDADSFASGVLHSRDGFLGRICGSPEIDELVERARTETDAGVRHAAYRGLEETLARDARLVPLFHEQAYRFARPGVEGLSVSYWTPVVRYEDLHTRSPSD